ncbi:unnamed protein product [Rotaria magnacalcarata]
MCNQEHTIFSFNITYLTSTLFEYNKSCSLIISSIKMELNNTRAPSRAQILANFQAITSMNLDDSIEFLIRYNWDLNDALEQLYPTRVSRTLTSLCITQHNDRHLARTIQNRETSSGVEQDISNIVVMGKAKRIAIVAHNNKKNEMIECLRPYRNILADHKLYGTGTTGALVEKELGLSVFKFESGPLGGDQQLGAKITARELDILLFLIDPLDNHVHHADVQALLRLAQVYGIVCGITAASIDFILSSTKMNQRHERQINLDQSSNKK